MPSGVWFNSNKELTLTLSVKSFLTKSRMTLDSTNSKQNCAQQKRINKVLLNYITLNLYVLQLYISRLHFNAKEKGRRRKTKTQRRHVFVCSFFLFIPHDHTQIARNKRHCILLSFYSIRLNKKRE